MLTVMEEGCGLTCFQAPEGVRTWRAATGCLARERGLAIENLSTVVRIDAHGIIRIQYLPEK